MAQEPEQRPTTDSGAFATEVVEHGDPNATQSIWKPALKEAGWAFAIAAVLISVIYALAFKQINPGIRALYGA
jgi:hypothetical protein